MSYNRVPGYHCSRGRMLALYLVFVLGVFGASNDALYTSLEDLILGNIEKSSADANTKLKLKESLEAEIEYFTNDIGIEETPVSKTVPQEANEEEEEEEIVVMDYFTDKSIDPDDYEQTVCFLDNNVFTGAIIKFFSALKKGDEYALDILDDINKNELREKELSEHVTVVHEEIAGEFEGDGPAAVTIVTDDETKEVIVFIEETVDGSAANETLKNATDEKEVIVVQNKTITGNYTKKPEN